MAELWRANNIISDLFPFLHLLLHFLSEDFTLKQTYSQCQNSCARLFRRPSPSTPEVLVATDVFHVAPTKYIQFGHTGSSAYSCEPEALTND